MHMCFQGSRRASHGAHARLSIPGSEWLRGIGYHECVAGMLDAATLDAMAGDRPVRIQHRSGRMWFLNSAALDHLLSRAPAPPGLEMLDGRPTGRLFEEDLWLRQTLGGVPPSLAAISALLASYGVTGITDMSPANDPFMARHFAREQAEHRLLQSCLMAGKLSLAEAEPYPHLQPGIAKLHLHENALPELDWTIAFVRGAHDLGWPVAVHCTTETELVFALAVIVDALIPNEMPLESAKVMSDKRLLVVPAETRIFDSPPPPAGTGA